MGAINYIVHELLTMPDMLNRTIKAINVGADIEEIRKLLIDNGLSEYEAWLTYRGALMCIQIGENE